MALTQRKCPRELKEVVKAAEMQTDRLVPMVLGENEEASEGDEAVLVNTDCADTDTIGDRCCNKGESDTCKHKRSITARKASEVDCTKEVIFQPPEPTVPESMAIVKTPASMVLVSNGACNQTSSHQSIYWRPV
ncbi:receptor-interacting serine/threonine-protein kinase 2-like [Platysternon megacephalum]|uniref:Receptor-interacting serine/threonine-protein kinase 2-like n=1 Tax=Platysternon megacephalum TaxID=55544 RepID=A0A4D9DVZ0_9SAUR|nr:receptor-interacting serine/threonine-protein kinase 2-like [Platysternon megacephalum]